jgi:hypothetical protein
MVNMSKEQVKTCLKVNLCSFHFLKSGKASNFWREKCKVKIELQNFAGCLSPRTDLYNLLRISQGDKFSSRSLN